MTLAMATLNPVEAYEELMRFAGKFGEKTLRLAFHAAVPQSFRTDLLHLIKVNFVPEARDDYTVEADLLLSPLCKDIGRGYFQFDPQVRLLLLDNLVKTYAAEKVPRLNRVANFILSYANHSNRLTSGNNDRLWKEYLETQRWVALAFVNPESAARQFAECLQNSVENKEIVTRLQLSGLAASLTAPLAAYGQLVNYASALETAETRGPAEAAAKFGDFLNKEIVVGDITLRAVSEIIQSSVAAEIPSPPVEEPESVTEFPPDPDDSADSYDVYISYAGADNEPLPSSYKGWVSHFKEALENFLTQMIGRKVNIWWDREIAPGSRFDEDLYYHLERSKIFIVIVTPRYVRSAYCLAELQRFNEIKPSVGTNSRVFKVVKTPVSLEEQPEILRRITGFDFYTIDPLSNIPRKLSPESDEESKSGFIRKINDLASEIARTLKILDEESLPDAEAKTLFSNFFNVPELPGGSLSVNRKKLLDEIRDLFDRNDASSIRIIERGINIVGLAGLGKTHLAAEYARNYRADYSDGVYWLDAHKNLDDQITEIARLNDWPEDPIRKDHLFETPDRLFIFDNVEKFEDIKYYLPEADSAAHVLLTSREEISGFYPIELEALELSEARSLLLEFSKRPEPSGAENEHLHELLRNIGGHPLALINVGTFLAKNQLLFGELNELLREISPELLEVFGAAGDFSKEEEISIRLLKIGEKIFTGQHPSNDVLEILSQSSVAGVGISLLSALVGTENASNLENVLNEAVDLNLVRRNEKTGRYAPNSLLIAAKSVEKALSDNYDWVETIGGRLLEWFETRAKVSGDLTEFENESDNLVAWQRNLSGFVSLTAVRLDLMSAKFSRSQEKYEEAQKLAESSLNKYLSLTVDRDERLLAAIYYELWMICFLKAEYRRALEYIFEQLKVLQRLFEESHPETAVCFDNIGRTFELLRDFDAALEHFQRALEIKYRVFGEKTIEVADSLEHISSLYSSLGELEKALELQQQALRLRQELLGQHDRRVAVSMSYLGELYNRLGEQYQALDYQQRAFEILSEIPESSAEMKIVEHRLVLLLMRLERLEEAEQRLLQSLENNTATDETYSLLGRVYKRWWETTIGDENAARQSLDKAIEAYRQAFEKYFDSFAGVNAITLMELKDPPDPRREELLQAVRPAFAQLVADKTPDYWDYATLLELAVLAGDREQAAELAAQAAVAVREAWEPETTVRNLRLIREARAKRNENAEWIRKIENVLSESSPG
jgi:tetratricopeptide (TPR) repeat protein